MKKMILAIALFVTASNLAVGITYAAVCKSAGGAKSCGESCTPHADGSCTCTGSCTKEERDWVLGTGGPAPVADVEN